MSSACVSSCEFVQHTVSSRQEMVNFWEKVNQSDFELMPSYERQNLEELQQTAGRCTEPSGGSAQTTTASVSASASKHTQPEVAFSKIVATVGNLFNADVCSIYLLDAHANELVLTATVGLRQDSIGQVRMNLQEGLVGLVAQKHRPVNVAHAPSHPRFKYFEEAGEEPFQSFLGVPLVDQENGRLFGVLVVQTTEAREFSEDEVTLLSVVAANVAPVVSQLAAQLHSASVN